MPDEGCFKKGSFVEAPHARRVSDTNGVLRVSGGRADTPTTGNNPTFCLAKADSDCSPLRDRSHHRYSRGTQLETSACLAIRRYRVACDRKTVWFTRDSMLLPDHSLGHRSIRRAVDQLVQLPNGVFWKDNADM